MGVPKFFRWVTDRYPTILSGPLSATGNNICVDNLYLDMNGVIHECARLEPNEVEDIFFETMLQNIFNEIRRIFDMVVPQKLLYIAVDGVAPRAKLNQQRARRFRSSKDRLKALQDSGAASSFDSNCITPGTEFMTKLSIALKVFIQHMMRTDSRWSKLQIHFSGSEVPGEGEHKIISYIRTAKLQPDYAPNLRHCILGADADMIMLALATHEPYFLVLRDALLYGAGTGSTNRGGRGGRHSNSASQTSNNATNNAADGVSVAPRAPAGKIMNHVRINVLRECLCTELLEGLDPAEYDAERVIDDFVFLTFLVGNDFLPGLPAINIGDQAFDLIFDAYKTVLASENGYLVHDGHLDRARLELIFTLIGVTEKSLFYDQLLMQELKLKQAEEKRAKYALLRAQRKAAGAAAGDAEASACDASGVADSQPSPAADNSVPASGLATPSSAASDVGDEASSVGEGVRLIAEAAAAVTLSHAAVGGEGGGEAGLSQESLQDREEQAKAAYYLQKFGIDTATAEGQAELRGVVAAYLTGLEWCLLYYTTGCSSWGWYYPYHYGPFLQDMTGLTDLPAFSAVATLGAPLKPFQQLLACLPAASASLLPAAYHALMNQDASPLAHIYPTEFATDRNGKKQEYEAVVLLPFIDIAQLLAAEAQHCPPDRLSTEETARNQFGVSYVYSVPSTSGTSPRNAATAPIVVTEHAAVVIPGVCFAPSLVPGTVPPSISIPGFPNKAMLAEVVNYTKGYGKSKAAKKNQRTRANCYGENGGTGVGVADVDDSAFPMPGLPTDGIPLRAGGYIHPVTAPPGGMADGGTAEIVPHSPTTLLQPDAPAPSADLTPMYPTHHTRSPKQSAGAHGVDSYTSLEIRLEVDARTSTFLHALAQQVAAQSPFFTPFGDEDDGTASLASTAAAVAHVSFSLSSAAGGSVVTRCREALVSGEVLNRAGTVFGTVTGVLQPVGLLGMDGTVSVKFVDNSHLAQLEEFLCQRLLGNDLLDSLCALSVSATAGAGAQSVSHSSGGLAASGVGFARKIVIGTYAGGDTERFLSWFNKELYKLQAYLPTFSCAALECVEETEEGVETKLACSTLSG
jgi:hypothetical protein